MTVDDTKNSKGTVTIMYVVSDHYSCKMVGDLQISCGSQVEEDKGDVTI